MRLTSNDGIFNLGSAGFIDDGYASYYDIGDHGWGATDITYESGIPFHDSTIHFNFSSRRVKR